MSDHAGPSITPIMGDVVLAPRSVAPEVWQGRDRAVDIWLSAYKSPNTKDAYDRDFRRWLSWCDAYGISIEQARRWDVDAYSAELEGADPPLKPKTIARRLAAVSSFYKYWVQEEVLPRNPAAYARRPKFPTEPSSIALTRDQAAQFIAAADADGPRSGLVVRMLLETGMRISELLRAGVDDLGVTSGHRTLGITRKGGKHVTIPLTPNTGHLIDDYLADRQAGPLLQTSGAKAGGVPQPLARGDVRDLLRRLAREAGLPREVCEAMHPHVTRHTVATLLDEAGVPIQEIQRLLGHADPRTTEIYVEHRKGLDSSPVYVLGRLLAA